ncbi:cytochrome P450 2C38-like [Tubulanus polymorphus]|uniref:cytochrome P450 2C38-like n=1 Tax=Tubulanus polymorphus TaxID=672921 RepID=UPI003DA2278C
MDFLTLVLGTILLGTFVYIFFNHRNRYHLPPGPRGYPLIGNSIEMFGSHSEKPLYQYLADLSKTYGDIFTFSAGFGKPVKMIILNSADAINQALVNQSGHFDSRPSVWSLSYVSKNKDIFMGNPSDPVWKLSRRLVTSGFRTFLSGSRLDGKVHCSVEKGIAMLLENNGKPIDMKPVFNLLVYNVICDMLFSVQFDLGDKDFKMIRLTESINNSVTGY